jgi:hypothetical protein
MCSPDLEYDVLDEFFGRPDELLAQVAVYRGFKQRVKSHASDWSWTEEMEARQDEAEAHYMWGGPPLNSRPNGTRREGRWIEAGSQDGSEYIDDFVRDK